MPFFDAPRLGGSMNKLTVILIIALMSCALCGCMSDEEWHREKKVIVANFVSSLPSGNRKIGIMC